MEADGRIYAEKPIYDVASGDRAKPLKDGLYYDNFDSEVDTAEYNYWKDLANKAWDNHETWIVEKLEGKILPRRAYLYLSEEAVKDYAKDAKKEITWAVYPRDVLERDGTTRRYIDSVDVELTKSLSSVLEGKDLTKHYYIVVGRYNSPDLAKRYKVSAGEDECSISMEDFLASKIRQAEEDPFGFDHAMDDIPDAYFDEAIAL